VLREMPKRRDISRSESWSRMCQRRISPMIATSITPNSYLVARYESWRKIQEEYSDYKTSLGPWSIEENEAYLKDEYPKIYPSAYEQLHGFVRSSNTVHVVSFA
jgi:hypothetical protein